MNPPKVNGLALKKLSSVTTNLMFEFRTGSQREQGLRHDGQEVVIQRLQMG